MVLWQPVCKQVWLFFKHFRHHFLECGNSWQKPQEASLAVTTNIVIFKFPVFLGLIASKGLIKTIIWPICTNLFNNMQQINHYLTLMLFALNRSGKWIPHNLETEYHTNAIMNTWLVMDLLCCDFKIHNICYVITDCLPVLSGDKSWGLASSLVQFCIRELALWLLQWDKNDLIIYLTLIEFPEFLQFTVHLIPPSHHNSSVNVIWITCSFQGGVCQSCPSTPWCIVPFHWEILRSFPSFCMTEALLSISHMDCDCFECQTAYQISTSIKNCHYIIEGVVCQSLLSVLSIAS